jgi:hypothetical protein
MFACELYASGTQPLSHCDGCREKVSQNELHLVEDDGSLYPVFFCAACKRLHDEAIYESEPECQCVQSDVDLFDARGCDLHDPNSIWNARLRAVSTVQRYNQEVA